MATHTLSSPLILDDDDAPQAVARSRKLSFMHRFYIAQQRRARRQIDRVLGGRAPEQAFRAPPPER